MSDWEAPYRIIGRGKAGWHASAPTHSSSGGTLEDYLSNAEDGCFVYDEDDSPYGAVASFVFSGPIVCARLAPHEIERFEDREALAAMAPGLRGGFEAIAASVLRGDRPYGFSSVDRVGADIYRALLREHVPGVRTGRVESGQIVWDDPC